MTLSVRDRIRRIQVRLGVGVDGIVGPATLTALEDTLKIQARPAPVDPGEQDLRFDDRTEGRLATLLPEAAERFRPFIAAAQALAAAMGCEYLAIQGNRTWEEQAALYAQGRTKPGPVVTNARPGSSWHNFGAALDFGVFDSGRYLDNAAPARAEAVHRAVGALALSYGLEWGGTWKSIVDLPHFQIPMPIDLAEARRRHLAGESLFD